MSTKGGNYRVFSFDRSGLSYLSLLEHFTGKEMVSETSKALLGSFNRPALSSKYASRVRMEVRNEARERLQRYCGRNRRKLRATVTDLLKQGEHLDPDWRELVSLYDVPGNRSTPELLARKRGISVEAYGERVWGLIGGFRKEVSREQANDIQNGAVQGISVIPFRAPGAERYSMDIVMRRLKLNKREQDEFAEYILDHDLALRFVEVGNDPAQLDILQREIWLLGAKIGEGLSGSVMRAFRRFGLKYD